MSLVRDEGVTKFQCEHLKGKAYSGEKITQLLQYRNILFEKGLIGVYPDGIGYGNVSLRNRDNNFFITATQTGHLTAINESHITLVEACDISRNYVRCRGMYPASSESLTHFMFYESDVSIQAVVHIHSPALWKRYLNVLPTSGKNIPYGTPQITEVVHNLYHSGAFSVTPVLVMAGHEDGLISFGSDLAAACEHLFRL